MIGRFIASQFRRPSGLIGHLIGNGMARNNQTEAHWTVDLLNIQPDMHVLEIGFGPGVGIQYAAQRVPQGHISGLDYSGTMLQLASKRNAAAIKSGHVDLRQGTASSLPYWDEAFDRVYTIHCIYFWTEPAACLHEIHRVLKANGMLAITIMPKDHWIARRGQPPIEVFTLYNGVDVAKLVTDAGFRDVHVEKSPLPEKFPGESILAVK